MIKVNFSYALNKTNNWIDLYAILPLYYASDECVKDIIGEIIKASVREISYDSFEFKIEEIEEIEELDISEF